MGALFRSKKILKDENGKDLTPTGVAQIIAAGEQDIEETVKSKRILGETAFELIRKGSIGQGILNPDPAEIGRFASGIKADIEKGDVIAKATLSYMIKANLAITEQSWGELYNAFRYGVYTGEETLKQENLEQPKITNRQDYVDVFNFEYYGGGIKKYGVD